jgi:peroxiredoxin
MFDRRLNLVTLLLLTPFVMLTVVLGIQNRKLRKLHQQTIELAADPHVGYVNPALMLLDLEGDSVRLGSPSARRQVLLAFNTTCPYCLESLPAWKGLLTRCHEIQAGNIELVGVSLDPPSLTRPYVTAHALSFRVVSMPPRWHRLFRFSSVPAVVVLV